MSEDHWILMRRQMPVTERWAYLDHAAVAPLPDPTRQVIRTWCDQAAEHGDTVWPQWAAGVERTRHHAAQLVNAAPDQIALIPNTTTGITLIAEGIAWRAGDNVVTLSNEFPSNLYPWMNLADRGVETRRVAVDDKGWDWSQIAAACDQRTRLLAVSWVGYKTGFRLNLHELVDFASQHRLQVLLDSIQGLGVFPMDVQQTPIDYVVADGHKWMLGPEGAGLLYIRPDRLTELRPLVVGWNSVVHAHDFSHIELKLSPTAARYEGGSANMPGLLGFGRSLELLLEFGLHHQHSLIAERVLQLRGEAIQKLQRLGARLVSPPESSTGSGILSFAMPDRDPATLRKQCLREGVALSCRGGLLRIALHAYNNTEDLDRLTAALVAG